MKEAIEAVQKAWEQQLNKGDKAHAILALQNRDLYTKRALAQAVLLIVEHQLTRPKERAKGGLRYSGWEGSCTLEHILPQTPDRADADWLEREPGAGPWSLDQHKKCLNKLGNLCLLNQSDNSKVSNRGFSDKLATLKGDHGIITSSGTAQTLQGLDKWDHAAYLKRHESLLNLLADRWNIPLHLVKKGASAEGKGGHRCYGCALDAHGA